jgi:hypothetical protein
VLHKLKYGSCVSGVAGRRRSRFLGKEATEDGSKAESCEWNILISFSVTVVLFRAGVSGV